MNKIKIINLPEITAADNTTYIPVSTGATNATRKISAANLSGFDNVSYLPQSKTSMEMSQARENIGAAKNSFAEIKDQLFVSYSADPLDPNGEEVFKIENSNTPGEPDITVNDYGYVYLRKGISLAAGADIEGVTSDDFFNLKDITSPVQAQLNSKAPTESPTFTGTTNFEGDVQVSENVIVDGDVRAYKNTVDNWLQFSSGAKIKIQTGTNGGTPVYREFPATELSSSDLNGTQYVMVYGTGTPEENAAELQAAYDAAKKMPRHIGSFNSGSVITIYKGQTFVNTSIPIKFFVATTDFTGTVGAAPAGTFEGRDLQSEFDAALAKRVTVIIASGEYKFATMFEVLDPGINVSSLTGLMDVKINSMVVSSGHSTIHGIDCMDGMLNVTTNYENVTFIKCRGGEASFGGSDVTSSNDISSTFIDCIGGDYSFGGCSIASGKFIRCTGGNYSFGGANTASGIFTDCTAGTSSFGGEGISTGKFIRCTADSLSFGSDTYGDSEYYYCKGGALSFGYNSDANGIYRHCIGGSDSFGAGTGSSIAGKFFYCEATGATTGMDGIRVYCIINNTAVANS